MMNQEHLDIGPFEAFNEYWHNRLAALDGWKLP